MQRALKLWRVWIHFLIGVLSRVEGWDISISRQKKRKLTNQIEILSVIAFVSSSKDIPQDLLRIVDVQSVSKVTHI